LFASLLFANFKTVLKKPKTNPENDPVENDLRKWRQLIIISAANQQQWRWRSRWQWQHNFITMTEDPNPLVQESVQEDDWNLPLDFHMFAQHESHSIYLNSARDFQIECVEALTPLDMMNLSAGIHDATGHCVWMGAFLLIAAIENDRMKEIFRGAQVIELGCGTGIGGIALLLAGESSAPSFLSFTDSDPNALALCGRNCESNLEEYQYQLEEVAWGTPLPPSVSPNSFDVVVAADVLYDISCLPLLLTTAKECLKDAGYFVLVHVPRGK
jgi:ribosomal protein L11 methylase PrmA